MDTMYHDTISLVYAECVIYLSAHIHRALLVRGLPMTLRRSNCAAEMLLLVRLLWKEGSAQLMQVTLSLPIGRSEDPVLASMCLGTVTAALACRGRSALLEVAIVPASIRRVGTLRWQRRRRRRRRRRRIASPMNRAAVRVGVIPDDSASFAVDEGPLPLPATCWGFDGSTSRGAERLVVGRICVAQPAAMAKAERDTQLVGGAHGAHTSPPWRSNTSPRRAMAAGTGRGALTHAMLAPWS
jgi:hypothetical protein